MRMAEMPLSPQSTMGVLGKALLLQLPSFTAAETARGR